MPCDLVIYLLGSFRSSRQHRVDSFRLADPTKPGHRSFVALWLVDPYQRIISTANVPPQQQSWWLENALAPQMEKLRPEIKELLARAGGDGILSPEMLKKAQDESTLPKELRDMLAEHLEPDDLLMSRAEAEEHRLKMMEERTTFTTSANSELSRATYNFCEH